MSTMRSKPLWRMRSNTASHHVFTEDHGEGRGQLRGLAGVAADVQPPPGLGYQVVLAGLEFLQPQAYLVGRVLVHLLELRVEEELQLRYRGEYVHTAHLFFHTASVVPFYDRDLCC